jgi:hypothetical protein
MTFRAKPVEPLNLLVRSQRWSCARGPGRQHPRRAIFKHTGIDGTCGFLLCGPIDCVIVGMIEVKLQYHL